MSQPLSKKDGQQPSLDSQSEEYFDRVRASRRESTKLLDKVASELANKLNVAGPPAPSTPSSHDAPTKDVISPAKPKQVENVGQEGSPRNNNRNVSPGNPANWSGGKRWEDRGREQQRPHNYNGNNWRDGSNGSPHRGPTQWNDGNREGRGQDRLAGNWRDHCSPVGNNNNRYGSQSPSRGHYHNNHHHQHAHDNYHHSPNNKHHNNNNNHNNHHHEHDLKPQLNRGRSLSPGRCASEKAFATCRKSLVDGDHPEVLKACVVSGDIKDVDELGFLINSHSDGQTLLMVSCKYGRAGCVKMLLDELHADVNMAGGLGMFTALHYASWHAHPDVVMMLLERGADWNAKNMNGETPQMAARGDCGRVLAEWAANPKCPIAPVRHEFHHRARSPHEAPHSPKSPHGNGYTGLLGHNSPSRTLNQPPAHRTTPQPAMVQVNVKSASGFLSAQE